LEDGKRSRNSIYQGREKKNIYLRLKLGREGGTGRDGGRNVDVGRDKEEKKESFQHTSKESTIEIELWMERQGN